MLARNLLQADADDVDLLAEAWYRAEYTIPVGDKGLTTWANTSPDFKKQHRALAKKAFDIWQELRNKMSEPRIESAAGPAPCEGGE